MLKTKLFFLMLVISNLGFSQADIVVQSGHTANVICIAYSHNGKYLLTGGMDNSIILWDFKSGMQVRTFNGHEKAVTSLCFSADDKIIVSGSYDQSIKVWDTYTGKCTNTINGFGYALTHVTFSQNSRYLAATSRDKTFNIWDLKTSVPVYHSFRSEENYGDMSDVCFDTLDNLYFSAWDGTIYMKNLRTDSDFTKFDTISLPKEFGHLNAMEVTSDGKYIMGGCDGSGEALGDFFVIEKATHKMVYYNQNNLVYMGNYSNSISVSSDNGYVAYCAGGELGVQILNLNTFKTDFVFPIKICTTLKFSHGGLFLSCAEENGVTEYNVRIGSALHEYKGFTEGVKKIELNTDGKITSYHDKALMVWDIEGGRSEPLAENIMNIEGTNIAVSHDRKQLAYEKKEKVYVYDLERKVSTNVLSNFEGYIGTLLYSANDKYLSVVGEGEVIFNTSKYDRRLVIPETEESVSTSNFFSSDNNLFISQAFGSDEFNIWDLTTKSKKTISYSANDIGPFATSKKYIAAIIKDRLSSTQSAFLSDVQNSYQTKEKRVVEDKDFLTSSASLDRPKYIVVWDINTLKISKALMLPKADDDEYTETPGITALAFDTSGNFIVMGSTDNIIRVWDLESGSIVKQMRGHNSEITSIIFTTNNKYMLSCSEDGSIIVWDGESYEQLATMILIGKEDYIVVTPENYYTCSKNGVKALAFRKDNIMYPFSQFDLKYNRPDKVLERLKSGNKELIKALKDAYGKRLQKTGIKEEDLDNEFHTPEVAVENIYQIPLNSTKPVITLDVNAHDNQSKIKSIQISINDVPQCNTYKIDAKNDDANYVEKVVEIKLMHGRNKIVITCLNVQGVESLPVELEVNYVEEKPGNIYFIGIAVANYKDADYNLKYTVKDIQDLAKAFKIKYPGLLVDTLLNTSVTRENILKLRQKVLTTNVNDMVIMAISGHGLLSKELDFYFATYDVDFKSPSSKGIKYEEIESLYDCIAARKKLLLLDACHSGEVDRDGNLKVKDVLPPGVKENRTKGSQLLESENNISLSNSFELMQDIFANLSKGNGSVVISAAGGREYALESDQWSNGVFTYCVLQALTNNTADANKNNETTISELKKYVSAEVIKLTAGRQRPTSRRENLLFDWKVW